MRSRAWSGGGAIAALALIVVLGLGLLYAYRSQTPAVPTVSPNEVVQQIRAGGVSEIVFDDSGRATVTHPLGSRESTIASGRPDDPVFAAALEYNRANPLRQIAVRMEPASAQWPAAVLSVLPVVLLIALAVFAARMLARGNGDDRYVKLARIADLRDRHALTEEEFEAEKRKIMR